MFHECRHIKTDGLRCHGAALRGKPYCYFHMNLRRMQSPKLSESQSFRLPPIEDTASVLLAVGQVIRTLDSPYADARRAGLMLYALQIAAQLTARKEKQEAKPSECVRTLYNPSGELVDFSQALDNGIDMLAPDNEVCEPPRDCADCPRQDTCDNYEEPEEEEEQEEGEEDEEEEQDEEDNDSEEDEDEDDQEENEEEDEAEGDEDGDLDEDDPVVKAALRILQKDSPSSVPSQPQSKARNHRPAARR